MIAAGKKLMLRSLYLTLHAIAWGTTPLSKGVAKGVNANIKKKLSVLYYRHYTGGSTCINLV